MAGDQENSNFLAGLFIGTIDLISVNDSLEV